MQRTINALAGVWWLLAACRPEPSRSELPWTRQLAVTELGDGACVIANGRVRCEGDRETRAFAQLPEAARVVRGKGGLSSEHCVLTAGGRVLCVGCADTRTDAELVELPFPKASMLELGDSSVCVLDAFGRVSCRGTTFDEPRIAPPRSLCELGRGEPRMLEGFPPAVRFAMTDAASVCLVDSKGGVYCGGILRPSATDSAGSLVGEGRAKPLPERRVVHLEVPRSRDLVAGGDHFCSLGEDGSVTCWGSNEYGQCGAPTEPCVEYRSGGCAANPTRVALDARATQVVAGKSHACALLEDGGVACWGENNHGALGFDSDAVCHPYWRGFCDVAPQRVPGVHHARELFAAKPGAWTWALDEGGRVLRWPERLARGRDPRPHAAVCRELTGAVTTAAVMGNENAFLGRRIRVRGRSTTTVLGQKRLASLDGLTLLPETFLGTPSGTELIVDGYVTKIHASSVRSDTMRGQHPIALGMLAYDVCRVSPP